MTEENKKTTMDEEVVENIQNETPMEEEKEEAIKIEKTEQKDDNKSSKKDFEKKPFKKNFKKRTFTKEKPEFEQKILSLRRVTRVMAGGRRFSFSVAMVIGDKKNRVGLGTGKANDVVSAIDKATRDAKKKMIKVKITDKGSVPFDLNAKYKASEIQIRPVIGKGLAAGGAVRYVLEFAGIKEAGAKILSRSKNNINNAKATIIALTPISERYIQDESKKKIMDTRKTGFRNDKRTPRKSFNNNFIETKKD
ncbi:30S ribosomal protein S5 [sediment metagenome]|uniref:30S ribosomal protein S5 n=1 Tax=sediment metagenome TaxID=749907 RepID=D9PHA9_9ZZZZ